MNCGISAPLATVHVVARPTPDHRHPDAVCSRRRRPRSKASCTPTPLLCPPDSCGCGTVDRQRCGRGRRTRFLHVAFFLLFLKIAAILAVAANVTALAAGAELVDVVVLTGGARHLAAAFFFLKYICPLCLRGDVNDKTFRASRAKPCARRMARRKVLGLDTRIIRLRTIFPCLL